MSGDWGEADNHFLLPEAKNGNSRIKLVFVETYYCYGLRTQIVSHALAPILGAPLLYQSGSKDN